jgi:ABC-type multidrug transport system ATPase subunit
MAIVTGSLFYNLPADSTSIFTRPGALFFPVQLFAMIKMSEMTASFMGRPILARHKRLAFARPGAIALSSAITDVPVVVIAFSVFNIVFYFMVNFERTAGAFFTNWFILVCYTLTFAGLYRMIGAWCRHFGVAAQITGWVTMVYLVYAGYMIPVPEMHPWFRWIAYLNPATYAFEAIMARELGGRALACVEPQYIPFGDGYADDDFRSCTVAGTQAGSSTISGDDYMATQYLAYRAHVWRNVGIIIGFWVFFTLMTAVGYEMNLHQDGGSQILFDRWSAERTRKKQRAVDVENSPSSPSSPSSSSASPSLASSNATITSAPTTFTFKDISYHVRHAGADLQLLRNVSGYVRPGELVALMGSSGAGKTTLMDVLAQRKDAGRIEGGIMVNGRPQDVAFQRSTGYCEQNDVHEPTATVGEALLFSARLRQPYAVPDADKMDYVESIMDLLELKPLRDAIIGSEFFFLPPCATGCASQDPGILLGWSEAPGLHTLFSGGVTPRPPLACLATFIMALRTNAFSAPGSGLSIEQRKRLTLATELVARPSLLFLDEPTSGLDGQSAYEICRFMRKLAAAGQTIICTIHQPSATLFDAFDVLLLLGRGGVTTYFGPTGDQSRVVLDYFARHGAECPEDANPAEHIVDVVQGRRGDTNWSDAWEASPEKSAMMVELDRLNATFSSNASSSAASMLHGSAPVAQDLEKAPTQPHVYDPSSAATPRDLAPPKSSFAAFATPLSYQLRLVTARQLVALWRNPDYSWNKIGLHISNGLFGGFTFWMIGAGTFDLQLRLMAMFNFVFVAPGCISQLQPLFIRNRDVFEAREKKAMTYHWFAFVGAQLISETPLLVVCGTIYFVCWYFTCGFPVEARVSGQVYLEMIREWPPRRSIILVSHPNS